MTKTGHIYVIDDDDSMRISLSRMLSELGYSVDHYQSGITFLKESLTISPAVILLDMQKPDMMGVALPIMGLGQ